MDIYVVGPVKRYFPLKRRENTTGKDSFANEFEHNFKAKTIPLLNSLRELKKEGHTSK